VAFDPTRILMQDFTGVPAIVDLAAMRDGIARLDGNPETIAEVGCFLGILCGLLDKIASDVKAMMMTELNEVQEPTGGGGHGASSTMPQKRNPISCAYIAACSSIMRQHTASLLNAMNADFERATGTWEIGWLVLPEVFCLSAGALAQAKYMLSGLVVHPQNMQKNPRLTDGLINNEAVMMALGPRWAGVRRTTG
jgi:3-carboxy-cis,cis-muconate cycloisomerase